MAGADRDSDVQTIVVVGLGMVGIGEHRLMFNSLPSIDGDEDVSAFIGKVLSLDASRRYRIVTCGEEVHRTYLSI